ncbi:MAG: RluA family pseudouridine synthase [Ktedonobacteraceae bacterium]
MHNLDTTLPYDTHVVQSTEVGQRLDRYLTSLIPDVSRTTIQHMITEEGVLVNGRSSKAGYRLREGDTIRVYHMLPSAQASHIKPQNYPLEIVYEDKDLLVINKAAGMVVHPAPGHHEDTLVNALVAHYPQLEEQKNDVRPGIVHRLDRDTSGLLIVAKNTRTQAALIEMMKRHTIVKSYLALVEGNISLDHGSIDAPIGRNPRNRQQMAITATGSREARTHFRVLERFARHTLLLLELETGRTHQIRVHLKAIGHPVVGDTVYGSGRSKNEPALQRQFLHAYQLKFQHPTTGEVVELDAPLPEDLQIILAQKNFL